MKLAPWSILKYGNIKNFVENRGRAGKGFSQEDVTPGTKRPLQL